jgi:chromosome partitioning protein
VPTISFVSSKGGVGKSTSSLLLALGLARRGVRVALIDSDPNLPLHAWGSLPGKPPEISLFSAKHFEDLPAALRKGKGEADWVVVDTEGGAPRMGALAIANADLVVTPLAASALEVREALKTAELVRGTSQRERRLIRFVCLFARTPAGYRRSFHQVSADLKDAGLGVLSTVLTDKEAYRSLFAAGGSLSTMNPRHVSGLPAARLLVDAYTTEVSALLGNQLLATE